jgi:DNA-binding NarL/FixJ family response regulator
VSRIRILLADPNASMLAMLTELLSEEFDIIGAVNSGADAVRRSSELQPDLILMDVVFDDRNGLELGNQLHKGSPEMKILYFSMYEGLAFIDAAFAAGASGYVFKSRANSDLLKAIRAVCRGEKFHPMNSVLRQKS